MTTPEDHNHRKRLIMELIKIKVKTGQPLDKILTKLTRDRYKHWNWSEVEDHIYKYYVYMLESTDEDAKRRLEELEQNY